MSSVVSRDGALTNPFRDDAQMAQALLAAIVESSDDAIVSKSLEGIITSWNRSAERLFGFKAEEAIGRHITIIIPDNRLDEEGAIIEGIRNGSRIDHYETMRRRKDGSLVDISLTVSPVRDSRGVIIGASKIARDISENKRAAERQVLVLREMNHRIKNIIAIVGAVTGLSERNANSTKELASDLRDRIHALAIAHELTLPNVGSTAVQAVSTTIFAVLRALFLAHEENGLKRLSLEGEDFPIPGSALTSFALLLHEFATNAVKYGALSAKRGARRDQGTPRRGSCTDLGRGRWATCHKAGRARRIRLRADSRFWRDTAIIMPTSLQSVKRELFSGRNIDARRKIFISTILDMQPIALFVPA